MAPLCGRLLRAVGCGRRLLPLLLGAVRGCHGGAAPLARALAVKKRGYDITRNPHLNKVTYGELYHTERKRQDSSSSMQASPGRAEENEE